MHQQRSSGLAVVIGASVAGLLAARALADAYERVMIIERDEIPEAGEGRRMVPQDRHAHVLLASGRAAVEELLPGITGEFLEAGARPCASLSEIRLVVAGHLLNRDARGADVLLGSRPLIEGCIRRRVLALPNVTVRANCVAGDLVTSSDRSRVIGVRIRPHGLSGAWEICEADLTVAAGGRSARIPALLEAQGYPQPVRERLPVDLRYVSRRLRLASGALPRDKIIGIGARPGLPRGLMLIEQENHWILTVSGYGLAHHPPSDEQGFLDFVVSVAPPDVITAIRQAEPLGDIVTYGFPANQQCRYDRLRRFPDGLLVTGDAIASFNPLYGQGMSVAALEAIQLRRCVEGGEAHLSRRFFRAAARIVGPAWDMAVGADLALPEVAGDRPLTVRLTNAYVGRLLRVAEQDPVVAEAFNDVSDLIASPPHLMRPGILWRILSVPGRRPGDRQRRVRSASSGALRNRAIAIRKPDRDTSRRMSHC